jgi:hypothetical protein
MFLPVPAPTAVRPADRRTVRAALLGAVVAGVLAAALPGAASLLLLAVAAALSVLAAAVGLRTQWEAATPAPARPARPQVRPATALPADLDAQLRALRTTYAAKIDVALATGRDDLVAELSDDYADESLRLLTGAPLPARTEQLSPLPHHYSEDDVHIPAGVKSLLRRFDRYTLEAFRPATPYRNELVRSGR